MTGSPPGTEDPGAAAEPTARERILQAALARFAVDGLAAPLRRVAADVGVSPGLIIHHFGSRASLLKACDQHALAVTRREKTALIGGPSAQMMLAQLARIDQYAPIAGYLLRRLQAGGPLAGQLIDDFAADAEQYLQQGERAGTINPSRDPVRRARALTEMALGALLLQLPAPQEHLDLDQLPQWIRSYTEKLMLPILELYTEPLLTDDSMLEAYLSAGAGTLDPDPPAKGPRS